MKERIQELMKQAGTDVSGKWMGVDHATKFAELIVAECINREELLGAIARGWCSEKNSRKTMDSDLALAIFDEIERQIKEHFGVEERAIPILSDDEEALLSGITSSKLFTIEAAKKAFGVKE